MIYKKKATLFIFFTLFALLFTGRVLAGSVDSPTIVETGGGRSQEPGSRFFIKGLTPANTEVLVYIDGVFVDFAKTGSKETESDSFYYEHQAVLAEENEIKLIARDKTSLVLSPPVEIKYIIPPLPAPTLVGPETGKTVGEPKPYITGLVDNWSFAHIYIDGVYNGKTEIVSHESGTANFAYKPFLNLSVGKHKVWAVAEDELGRKSGNSNILEFIIEPPMPAPTLLSPVINTQTKFDQPFIVGLAKNDSLIEVFIDNSSVGRFAVENHPSGAANFAFKAPVLARGSHSVYTTAADSRGKVSKNSNIINFSARQTVISEGAREEKDGLVGEIKEPSGKAESDKALVISSSGDIEKDEEGTIEEAGEKDVFGAVDESRENQGKLSANLIVFIIFLLAIIGWIFWVNRELAKEQKENKENPEDPLFPGENNDSPDKEEENKLF
ncbi:MAG: hypothetical protein PHQ42_00905 [Patescibacteria group bacterium]|nr:hypothetical protein [Patescibacteria group bacterium]